MPHARVTLCGPWAWGTLGFSTRLHSGRRPLGQSQLCSPAAVSPCCPWAWDARGSSTRLWPLGAPSLIGILDPQSADQYLRAQYMTSFWLADLWRYSEHCPGPCGRLLLCSHGCITSAPIIDVTAYVLQVLDIPWYSVWLQATAIANVRRHSVAAYIGVTLRPPSRPIQYLPAQRVLAKTEALLPSRFFWLAAWAGKVDQGGSRDVTPRWAQKIF